MVCYGRNILLFIFPHMWADIWTAYGFLALMKNAAPNGFEHACVRLYAHCCWGGNSEWWLGHRVRVQLALASLILFC